MPKKAKSEGLSDRIAGAIRALRSEHDVSQNAIAQAARSLGLRWSSATVANIEAGRRKLSLDEFALLPAIVYFAVPLADEYAPDRSPSIDEVLRLGAASESVLIAGSEYRFAEVGAILRGGARDVIDARIVGYIENYDSIAAKNIADANVAEVRRWWPRASRTQVAAVRRAALEEAERKAAVRLQVRALDVSAAAFSLWGVGLTARRDAIVNEQGGNLDPRSLQALRGHVTRGLIDEIRARIEVAI